MTIYIYVYYIIAYIQHNGDVSLEKSSVIYTLVINYPVN